MSNSWLCVECGEKLGEVLGGELTPAKIVPQENLRTRGPNLVFTCPKCGAVKVWYTADPVVRATYQLVDSIASALAGRVMSLLSDKILPHKSDQ